MPMTCRHKYTKSYLDSNYIRIMSYNILAACYTDSMFENEYEYCKYEFLNFNYRKPLLLHEIPNYNCDIVFLQECDADFVLNDLNACMCDFKCLFLEKSRLTNEGEAILIRNNKLKFIKSFDINFAEKFKTFDDLKFLRDLLNKDQLSLICDKGNILQVALTEFIEMPGYFLLLANTHLYSHQSGHFVRLIQAIISAKYLEELKRILLNDKLTKKVNIIFAGDFNSAPNSTTIKYILNGKIEIDDLDLKNMTEEEINIFEKAKSQLSHSTKFISYDDTSSTNFGCEFEGVLDYLFYEDEILEMTRTIPFPSIEKIRENVAIPNQYRRFEIDIF
ncbi:2 -5 -phosphodiesterase [Brachionus plicatilis]|uniref:2-5-phosphodiesterase n=1 Tax=Brachionus plicatilis TaxID=10195 RepID=A0A3M7SRS1_BRAPC|nr:2 -5 -phosphodiesterase [Brachionus plicatilis]